MSPLGQELMHEGLGREGGEPHQATEECRLLSPSTVSSELSMVSAVPSKVRPGRVSGYV